MMRISLLGLGTTIIAIVLIISGIKPYDRMTWLMEVIPVLIVMPVLFMSFKKFPLTNLLYNPNPV